MSNFSTQQFNQANDFLNFIFPEVKGFIEIRTIDNFGKIVRKFFQNIREATTFALEIGSERKYNVYVGMAERKNDKSGTKENILQTYTKWCEIDATSYDNDKERALKRIQELQNLSGFPAPSVVNSTGHGYHLIWRLEEPFEIKNYAKMEREIERFEITLKGLMDFCNEEKQKDVNVAELSRILRVPGTFNIKEISPLPVETISFHKEYIYSNDIFLDFLERGKKVKNISAERFKTKQGTGIIPERYDGIDDVLECQFLKYAKDHGKDLIEPLWYDLITVLTPYKGGKEKIHELSRDYYKDSQRKYDYHNTEKKINQVIASSPGPHLCSTIAHNGFVCPEIDTCFANSPASLGRSFEKIKIKDGVYAEYWIRAKTGKNGEMVEKEGYKKISNFVIKPLLYMKCEGDDYVRAKIISKKAQQEITIPPQAWTSKQSFIKMLAPMGWTSFWGSNDSAQHIKGLVFGVEGLPEKRGCHALGRYGDLFLIGEKTISKDGFLADSPLVYLPRSGHGKGDLIERIKFKEIPEEDYKDLVSKIYKHLPKINEPLTIWPIIGWFFATPFKTLCDETENIEHFPHLNLSGGPGSGKTHTGLLFWKMFGINSSPFAAKETNFPLLFTLSNSNAIPIFFDEYKPSQMDKRERNNFHSAVRQAYNCTTVARGKPDQTVVSYKLTAPIIIAGEGSFLEQALYQRQIPVQPQKIHKLPPGCLENFRELIPLDLSSFAFPFIKWCLSQDFKSLWIQANEIYHEIYKGPKLENRIEDNIKIMLLGFIAFERFGFYWELESEETIPIKEIIENTIKLLIADTSFGALNYFLEKLSVMAMSEKIKYKTNYFMTDSRLYIHLSSSYSEFRRFARETELEGEILDENAYRRELRECEYVTGYSETHAWEELRVRCYEIDLENETIQNLDLQGFQQGKSSFEKREMGKFQNKY
jgi:hypothetical protein